MLDNCSDPEGLLFCLTISSMFALHFFSFRKSNWQDSVIKERESTEDGGEGTTLFPPVIFSPEKTFTRAGGKTKVPVSVAQQELKLFASFCFCLSEGMAADERLTLSPFPHAVLFLEKAISLATLV